MECWGVREGIHACQGQGRGVSLPGSPLDAHSIPFAWTLTPISALAASMEQRAGPPEPRPAGPTTHLQPKVSPGLAGHDGRDRTSPSPAHGALSLMGELWSGLMPLCCALLQEGTLWKLLTILSLLAGLATGTLQTPHCNETLDTAPTPRGMATASPAVEDGVEVPLTAAWSQLYGACWGRTPSLGMVALSVGGLGAAVGSPSPHRAASAHRGQAGGGGHVGCFMLGMMAEPRE